MDFVTIPATTFDLGWRFTLPAELRADADLGVMLDEQIAMCSRRRSVALPSFQIARDAVRISEFIGDPYDLDIDTLAELCDLVDQRLGLSGLRLPTEDELEAVAGGMLFPWGDYLPPGIPYPGHTSFLAHTLPNAFGLQLLGNPYQVELCRAVLKFGDGGCAVCGGLPWPVPWLSLSPCFRLTDGDIADCFPETFEECFVRPVRCG